LPLASQWGYFWLHLSCIRWVRGGVDCSVSRKFPAYERHCRLAWHGV
jgi:hypothetical protein